MKGARVLMEAVLEALTMPSPASLADRDVHDRILADRVVYVRIVLESALKNADDVDWAARYLRGRLAERPATGYRAVGESLEGGGE